MRIKTNNLTPLSGSTVNITRSGGQEPTALRGHGAVAEAVQSLGNLNTWESTWHKSLFDAQQVDGRQGGHRVNVQSVLHKLCEQSSPPPDIALLSLSFFHPLTRWFWSSRVNINNDFYRLFVFIYSSWLKFSLCPTRLSIFGGPNSSHQYHFLECNLTSWAVSDIFRSRIILMQFV